MVEEISDPRMEKFRFPLRAVPSQRSQPPRASSRCETGKRLYPVPPQSTPPRHPPTTVVLRKVQLYRGPM